MVGLERWGCVAAVSVIAACGCRPALPGTVSAGRYESASYNLVVVGDASDPESPAAGLMPPGWKLDNFHGSRLPDEPKTGDRYQIKYRCDSDDDAPRYASEQPIFQLRFKSLKDGGVVWLRTVPVSEDLSETQLSTLMTGLVDSFAGGEYESVVLSSKRAVTLEKRYAATLVAAQPCRLAEQECLAGTVELADVDQLRLSASHRTQKVELVLVRSPFRYEERRAQKTCPVYLLAGYANQPSDFDKSLPVFRELLSRVEVAQQRGFALAPTTAPAPDIAPAAAAAPSAPAAASAAPPAASAAPPATGAQFSD